MGNKYYTPSIEEFHIGFEYEIRFNDVDNIWDKEVFTHDSHDPDYNPYFYIMKWIDNSVRVKCLDKEDIESLGFAFTGKAVDDWYKLDKHIRLESGHWFTKFKLQHDRSNSFTTSDDFKYNIKITAEYAGGEDTLFEGVIKNKSELQCLLKQLGILN